MTLNEKGKSFSTFGGSPALPSISSLTRFLEIHRDIHCAFIQGGQMCLLNKALPGFEWSMVESAAPMRRCKIATCPV
jgi:hypothetical protein